MSALPPKADMCSAQADVRLVPIADVHIVRLSRNETPGTLPGVFMGWDSFT